MCKAVSFPNRFDAARTGVSVLSVVMFEARGYIPHGEAVSRSDALAGARAGGTAPAPPPVGETPTVKYFSFKKSHGLIRPSPISNLFRMRHVRFVATPYEYALN